MIQDWLLRRQRKLALRHTQYPAMQRLLSAPLPSASQPARDCGYLAVDLEMTGLDSTRNRIVSIGWVAIDNNHVINGSAQHHFIQQRDIDLDESAPIHNIRHCELDRGTELHQAFDALLTSLAGRVLILHHAPLDLSFIHPVCQQLYGTKLITPVVDTLHIEQRKLRRQGLGDTHSVRLHACRARYNLPVYQSHNAVIDAIATAELWLAYLANNSPDESQKLGTFLSRS